MKRTLSRDRILAAALLAVAAGAASAQNTNCVTPREHASVSTSLNASIALTSTVPEVLFKTCTIDINAVGSSGIQQFGPGLCSCGPDQTPTPPGPWAFDATFNVANGSAKTYESPGSCTNGIGFPGFASSYGLLRASLNQYCPTDCSTHVTFQSCLLEDAWSWSDVVGSQCYCDTHFLSVSATQVRNDSVEYGLLYSPLLAPNGVELDVNISAGLDAWYSLPNGRPSGTCQEYVCIGTATPISMANDFTLKVEATYSSGSPWSFSTSGRVSAGYGLITGRSGIFNGPGACVNTPPQTPECAGVQRQSTFAVSPYCGTPPNPDPFRFILKVPGRPIKLRITYTFNEPT